MVGWDKFLVQLNEHLLKQSWCHSHYSVQTTPRWEIKREKQRGRLDEQTALLDTHMNKQMYDLRSWLEVFKVDPTWW